MSVVVHDNKFVLFGGFDGAQWLNDMFEFDISSKTWKQIEAHGLLPSMHLCPAWAQDDQYVYIHSVSFLFVFQKLKKKLVTLKSNTLSPLINIYRAMMASNARRTSLCVTCPRTHGQNFPARVRPQVHGTSTLAASLGVSCIRMGGTMAVTGLRIC